MDVYKQRKVTLDEYCKKKKKKQRMQRSFTPKCNVSVEKVFVTTFEQSLTILNSVWKVTKYIYSSKLPVTLISKHMISL